MLLRRTQNKPNPFLKVTLSVIFILILVGGFFAYRWFSRNGDRAVRVMSWIKNSGQNPDWMVSGGNRCGDAPFLIPTSGFIGFLWDDSFRLGHHHQGIDIFGGKEVGVTPVYSAFSGFLTRLPDWKSSLIIRIPSDPLKPQRQIWTYYTHMASEDGESFILPEYPMGTSEMFIDQGVLLGNQGNYSGDPNNPTGVHLHFSIVKDDGNGSFMNELRIQNTINPSPYLGMKLDANESSDIIPKCEELN